MTESSVPVVCVVGLGYIGLPTAAVMAGKGLRVVGVDVNPAVVAEVNAGRAHVAEPGLGEAVAQAVAAGRLRATDKPEPADVFIIAVPTPFAAGKVPDVSFVRAAALAVAPVLRAGNLVLLESTSPVGTTARLAQWLSAARPDLGFPGGARVDVNIAYCPERVLPGRMLEELVANDRVIGGLTPACTEAACAVYKRFVAGGCHRTDAATAELCKLAENAYRDVNIAFANELSLVCDAVGVDVWELVGLANRHPRVNILRPGPGVGGHCIAVDPWFIVAAAPAQARLIRAAREVNDGMPRHVLDRVRAACAGLGRRPVIACFGLAFKADVDDLRESPALEIVHALLAEDAGQVLVVEPFIRALPAALAGATLVEHAAALRDADVAVLLVDHSAFRGVGISDFRGRVVDTRGLWR